MAERDRRILQNYCHFLVRGFEARILSPVEHDGAMWLNCITLQICISDRKHGAAPRFTYSMRDTRLSACPSNVRALVVQATAAEPRCVLLMAEESAVHSIITYWHMWLAAGHPLGEPCARRKRRFSGRGRRSHAYEELLSCV